MIDLTPLDVRKKKGDFRRAMRGYDPPEVEQFLEMVADRMEEIVTENLTLRERVDGLLRRVEGQEGREKAVQEALVTAQSLREEMREQSRREAELQLREAEAAAKGVVREAEAEAERIRAATTRELEERQRVLRELERSRTRFLRAYRALLDREAEALDEEEARPALNDFDVEALTRALPDAASEPRTSAWGAREDAADPSPLDSPAAAALPPPPAISRFEPGPADGEELV